MRILPCFCFLAATLSLTAAAQQAPTTPPSTAPNTSRPALQKKPFEVILPVTVRDKHGNLVPNLTAADFTLTEDGRSQTITGFAAKSNQPLQLGILIDTSRSVSPAISTEGKAAEKFVQTMLPADPKQPGTPTQAFLIHFDNEVELLEDFTNSRDKLDHELDQLGPTGRGHSDQGPETHDDSGSMGGQGQNRPSHGGTQVYDAIYLASSELMQPKPGRKALVVFSDGVDRSSKETQSEAIDAAERAGAIVYTIYFRGGEERQEGQPGGMGRHGGGYPGGGGGYPGGGGGYPGGGYPGGRRGGGEQRAPVDGKKVMQDIANRTGGQFFEAKKSSNLDEIYGSVAQDLNGQYVLTYTSDKPDDEGGYHKIELKPKKDDLSVTTRHGYYAPGGTN